MAENFTIRQTVDLSGINPNWNAVRHDALMYPGDNLAHTWEVQVKRNGIPVDMTGGNVVGYFQRKDGNTVMVNGTIENSICRVTMAQECYAISGAMKAVMRYTEASTHTVITLAYHAFTVQGRIDDGGIIDPGEVIPSIDDLLAEIEAMEQATAAAEAAANKSVRYDSAQTLTDAQKEQARGNIGAASEGDVTDLKSEIEQIDDTLGEYIAQIEGKNKYNPATVTDGIIINNQTGAITESSGRETTDFIAVAQGQRVTVTENYKMNGVDVQNLKKPIYVPFYNANKEFITGGSFNTQNTEITAGCAYIRVTLSKLEEGRNYQIELTNNGTPTPYEPYQEGTTEVIADFVTEETEELLEDLSGIPNASGVAAGKALMAKTVADGKVTSWEFGSPAVIDDTLTQAGEAADAKAAGDAIASLADSVDRQISEMQTDIESISGKIDSIDDWESAGNTDLLFSYHSAKTVKFSSETSTSFSVRGVTVADFDHIGTVTYNKVELVSGYTGKGRKYRITELGTGGLTYRVDGTVSGLIPGHTYIICLKVTDPQNDSSGGGHYAQVLSGGKSAVSYGTRISNEQVYCVQMTASRASNPIYIYPFQSNGAGYTQAVGDEFVIEDVYINEIYDNHEIYTHENVFAQAGTGTEFVTDVYGSMFIATSEQTASVSISAIPSKIQTINGIKPDLSGDMTVKSHLQGKTVVCFGDSITNKGYAKYKDYPYLSSLITGMNTINVGIGGTSMRYRTNYDNWNKVSFAHMADMIASGDFTDIQTLGNTSGFEMKDRCAQLYPVISAIDWNSVDIITVAFGANDHETSTVVNYRDDESDKMNKYKYLGAFRYALETILAQYPQIQFLVITPVFRFWTIQGEYTDSDKREFPDINSTTSHYYEWGDDLMKCAKDEYHVPVVDFYRELGISEVNHAWFSTDGVHPDYDGLARMASHLASALMSKF
jgi:lysophospholipase L1-like esterase